jgi:ubiquinone/menaquinone biosynthesis C-methylase UbiE
MREFWDERAREDAYYFVDNRQSYRSGDLRVFWSRGAEDLEQLLVLLGASIEPTDEVLEIGCGVGRLTRELAARAQRVQAIDISSEMIAIARKHHRDLANVSWIVGDGTSLAAVQDESVDVCISHVTFQHIPDPAVTLGYVAEMGRVLRPGGWAAFQVSNAPDVHRPLRTPRAGIVRVLSVAGLAPRGQRDPAWLGSSVELADLRAVAERSGLALYQVLGEGTLWCAVLARRISSPAPHQDVQQ